MLQLYTEWREALLDLNQKNRRFADQSQQLNAGEHSRLIFGGFQGVSEASNFRRDVDLGRDNIPLIW
jgi:hypothetical protein